MEVFEGAHFVRLRSWVRNRCYLAAEDDGMSVCLATHRDAHNTVWAVQHCAGPSDGGGGGAEGGNGPHVLLRSAFGRYLYATDRQATTGPSHGVTAVQHSNHSQQPTPPGMLWQAVPRRASYVIRNATGRCLRANGRYLRWRTAVTVADDSTSTMLQWEVEVVPVRFTRPRLTRRSVQLRHRRTPPMEWEVTREIRYVHADPDGNYDEQDFRTIWVNTICLVWLQFALCTCVGHNSKIDLMLCVRAGCYAQLSPLLIDLPIGREPIDIVLLSYGTPAENTLWYPNIEYPGFDPDDVIPQYIIPAATPTVATLVPQNPLTRARAHQLSCQE